MFDLHERSLTYPCIYIVDTFIFGVIFFSLRIFNALLLSVKSL